MIVQYACKLISSFYFTKLSFDDSDNNLIKTLTSYQKIRFIERSFSNSRKIFRFLNWVDNLKFIYYYLIYKSQNGSNEILKALMNLFSLFYHFLDNFVWYVNLGLIDEYILGISLKTIKRLFSLLRLIIKLLVDFLKLKNFNKNKSRISSYQRIYMAFFTEDEKKAKIHFSVIHSLMRCVLLLTSLRVPPFSLFNPLVIDFIGVLHSLISFYKYYQKEYIESIVSSDEVQEDNKKLEEAMVDLN